jgi:hypothetical protein
MTSSTFPNVKDIGINLSSKKDWKKLQTLPHIFFVLGRKNKLTLKFFLRQKNTLHPKARSFRGESIFVVNYETVYLVLHSAYAL